MGGGKDEEVEAFVAAARRSGAGFELASQSAPPQMPITTAPNASPAGRLHFGIGLPPGASRSASAARIRSLAEASGVVASRAAENSRSSS
jgi:hypothetical protein